MSQLQKKLSKAWQGVYDAYNALEDIRPGGGFENLDLSPAPEPSEEELVKILQKHNVHLEYFADGRVIGTGGWYYAPLLDALMSWSRSGRKQEPPVWCRHVVREDGKGANPISSWRFDPGNWGTLGNAYVKDWTCCPICGAPRPGEGP